MLSFILATALASPCLAPPKPVKHKRKAKTHIALSVPLCTAIEPRTILLPAPEPLEPIPVTVVRYEIIQAATPPADNPPPADWWPEPMQFWAIGGSAWFAQCCPCDHSVTSVTIPHSRVYTPYQPSRGTLRAPEIDPSSGIAAVTMLAMFIMIVLDRKPRK